MTEKELIWLADDRDFWKHQFLVAWAKLYIAIMDRE